MAQVELRSVVKDFGETRIVKGIDLIIYKDEFVALVGPSGCGKTTTLRMIAGLEEITSGEIQIGDIVINDVDPKDRDIAMVFQSYALYPHMTVYENIAFGLKMRGLKRDEMNERISFAAKMLDIEGLLDRRPKQLSGGQRQRVAMGRAIVRRPKVFLFDEPLSNLDAKLRVQMRTELKRIHQKVKTTTIYVTHDQVEAMTLADRIVVMNDGQIEQVGTPSELYHSPRTKFVAGFIGSPSMKFLSCHVVNDSSVLKIKLSSGIEFPVPSNRYQRYLPFIDKEMLLGLRPEHITDLRSGEFGQYGEFEVTVDVIEPMGGETEVYFLIDDKQVCCRVAPETAQESGSRMSLFAHLHHMHLIDPSSNLVV